MIERDRAAHFDREAWRALCRVRRARHADSRRSYGGLALGLTDLLAVMEGLGYGTRDQGLLFSLNAHLWTNSIPILLYGTDEQQQALPAPALRRHADRRERGVGAGRGLRHLQHADARRARRRSLRAQRHQDLRHERAGRRPVRRLRHRQPGARRHRHHRLHHRARHAGPDDQPASSTRWACARRRWPKCVFEDCRIPVDAAARPRGPRRPGLRVLDGVGARLHPRQLPRRHAASARELHRSTRVRASSSASRSASSSRSPTGSWT